MKNKINSFEIYFTLNDIKKFACCCVVLLMTTSSISYALDNVEHPKPTSQIKQLEMLEKSFDGKIGVYAIDTKSNQIVAYRADERFPVQSTMKLMAVSALLKQSDSQNNLLQEEIHYTKNDLIVWHPITGKNLIHGMTLEELSEAAMSYSDNTAVNLVIQRLGGPKAVTDFAHSIGNMTFNVEHYEADLNSNPHDTQDTSTPKDMAISLQKLTLGYVLTPSKRALLVTWMRNSTTSYKRIRASVPIGWVVADKTGSGDYGIANDVGVLWPPLCKPIVLAIYTVQDKQNAKPRDDIIASITDVVVSVFSKQDKCC